MLKSTTEGTTVSAIDLKGFAGMKRSRKLMGSGTCTVLTLKKEAVLRVGNDSGINRIKLKTIDQNNSKRVLALMASVLASSWDNLPIPAISDTTIKGRMDIWRSLMKASPTIRSPEQYSPKKIPHATPRKRLKIILVDKENLRFM